MTVFLAARGAVTTMNIAEENRSRGHMARRQNIVDAARALAAEEGWLAVTVRRIAARIGCSAPAIYQYFPDKAAVLDCIATEARDQLAAAMQTAAGEASGPAKRLRAMARAYWDFSFAHPELYAVLFGMDDPARATPATAAPEVLRAAAADLVGKKGLLTDADGLADQVQALLHGFAVLAHGNRFPGGPTRAREMMTQALDALLRGQDKQPQVKLFPSG